MKITSFAFENNAKIPAKYTCDGENINPPLAFLDIPANAKSLVLIVDDPDAPMGIWVHWLVFNIDPKTNGISENSKFTNAKEGVTSFGGKGYGGPCPPARLASESVAGRPSGTHRYFFKLYALDEILSLNNPNKEELEQKMQGHILNSVELIGLYSRI